MSVDVLYDSAKKKHVMLVGDVNTLLCYRIKTIYLFGDWPPARANRPYDDDFTFASQIPPKTHLPCKTESQFRLYFEDIFDLI
jgi:hypothetical protein